MDTLIQMSREAQRELPESNRQRRLLYELLALVLFAGLAGWLMTNLLNPATLPIRQVRIEGEFKYLSPEVLRDRAESHVKGGFFNINVAEVRDRLLAEPWVRSVSVHRVWPDSLQVFVTEQIAVAAWKDSGLLNRQGEYFTPDGSTFPEGLPVISGPDGYHEQMVDKYYTLQKQLEPFALNLQKLSLDDRRAWSLELDNGLVILLGRKNFRERFNRFITLVPLYLNRKIDKAEQIDLRYPNGFAVKWKSGNPTLNAGSGAL